MTAKIRNAIQRICIRICFRFRIRIRIRIRIRFGRRWIARSRLARSQRMMPQQRGRLSGPQLRVLLPCER